jgi:hypothetical protein
MYGPSQEMKAPSNPPERQPVFSSPPYFHFDRLMSAPLFLGIVCSRFLLNTLYSVGCLYVYHIETESYILSQT